MRRGSGLPEASPCLMQAWGAHQAELRGLLHQRLLPSLQHYLHTGGHTIRAWADTHRPAWAVFEQPHDHPLAFYNANTLQELQQLEQWCAPPSSPP